MKHFRQTARGCLTRLGRSNGHCSQDLDSHYLVMTGQMHDDQGPVEEEGRHGWRRGGVVSLDGRWGMLFNAEKSEHLAISTRKSDITSPHVTMNGTQIPQVTSHKHLGVNFNNMLSWQQHVDKVYTSCARRIGMIRRLRRKLHPVVLKRIYLGAVLPKLEYACPVWCGGPTQKLIKMHANFCRRNGTALPSLQTRFDYHTLIMFY